MVHVRKEWIEFANLAANHFAEHKEHNTFTIDKIETGCLFAVKWGLNDDCVLVFQLDSLYDPLIFTQIIKEKQ